MMEDARSVLMSRGGIVILALSLFIHLSGALALWSVAWGVGLDVPLLACLVLVPPAMLVATLPISLGGWGVREGVLVAAFAMIGISADAALAVSVAFGLLVMASGGVGLAVWFAGDAAVSPPLIKSENHWPAIARGFARHLPEPAAPAIADNPSSQGNTLHGRHIR